MKTSHDSGEAGPRPTGEDDRGRDALGPSQIPARGWLDVLLRVWREVQDDRLTLVAAGVTFYLLLAIFPALAAIVSVYGLVTDPAILREQLNLLETVAPAVGLEVIREQLDQLIARGEGGLSLALILSLCLALWSTNAGMKAMFQALNVAYGEREKRGFVHLTLLTLGITVGAMILSILFLVVVGAVPVLLDFLRLPSDVAWLIEFVRWPILLCVMVFCLTVLYRLGPSRRAARLPWLTWGSVFTAVAWLAVSIGFSWYLANFSSYDRTYGSLGAVIGFLMWVWLSVLVVLIGAELNAEMEHQTSVDSTVGPDRPMGERGAMMADTVGAALGQRSRSGTD